MIIKRTLLSLAILVACYHCQAQFDSTIESLQKIPAKYFDKIENKIDKYSNRITGKTVKTLTKLSRWEKKIQLLLEKANPEAANNLFGPGKTTFTSLLQ